MLCVVIYGAEWGCRLGWGKGKRIMSMPARSKLRKEDDEEVSSVLFIKVTFSSQVQAEGDLR